MEKVKAEIIKDPTIQGVQKRLNYAKGYNLPTEDIENEYRSRFDEIVDPVYRIINNLPIERKEQAGSLIKNLSDETLRIMLREASTGTRFREEMPLKERGVAVEEAQVGVRRGELALEREKLVKKPKEDYYKNIHDKVEFVLTFLKGLKSGNKESILFASQFGFTERLEDLLGESITEQNVGRLMERLSQIDTKAMKGKELTDDELSEIDSAFNVFKKQREFDVESEKMAAYEQCVSLVKGYGADEATARRKCAEKYGIAVR